MHQVARGPLRRTEADFVSSITGEQMNKGVEDSTPDALL